MRSAGAHPTFCRAASHRVPRPSLRACSRGLTVDFFPGDLDAALTRDLPEDGLCVGDVVKIVDHHPVPGGEDGYSIEVFNAVGDTIAVTSVPESWLEPLLSNEVFSVRRLATAA
ncbi:MAG: DUF4926 domain-containing protein [Terrimicrobiaceae bacterium]|nr:DUF4926 domain-containing protein [Terrimicrobiaceae bacterium]